MMDTQPITPATRQRILPELWQSLNWNEATNLRVSADTASQGNKEETPKQN